MASGVIVESKRRGPRVRSMWLVLFDAGKSHYPLRSAAEIEAMMKPHYYRVLTFPCNYSRIAYSQCMKAATDKASIALRVVADPNRRKALRLLRTSKSPKGLNAGDLEAKLKLAQPTISHHMKMLKKAGLIETKKEGTYVWYSRNESALKALRTILADEL